MEDDIDIEEHDLMDNPHIKTMFPDITSIKTEVEDYEEQVSETVVTLKEEDPYIPYNELTSNHSQGYYYIENFKNKIILGSKPSTSNSPEPVFGNKIILGSKACLMEIADENEDDDKLEDENNSDEENNTIDDPKLITASVVLEDCRTILENNPCFCQHCEILFPNVNSLDFHTMNAHSFLVAVSNNKAIKSTSRGSISARIKVESSESHPVAEKKNKAAKSTSKGSLSAKIKIEPSDDRNSLICNHCNEIFPNEIALIKHTYELLPGKFECNECNLEFDSEVAFKSHKLTHFNNDCLLCPVCTCHFKLPTEFHSHMWKNHGLCETYATKYVTLKNECLICTMKLQRGHKKYNAHVANCHSHLFTQLCDDVDGKFKCSSCNQSFPSVYALKIHRVAKHSNEPETEIANDDDDVNIPVPQKMKIENSKTLRFIPTSVLFKCDKCQIHFVSCSTAVEHSKRCRLNKGDWKCHICRHTFMQFDRLYHNLQHGLTNEFKIYVTKANILNRLLCKCKDCLVCFDERSLSSYHAKECSPESPSIQCPDCYKRIGSEAFGSHRKLHIDGFSLSDFIVVNYTHINDSVRKGPSETLLTKRKRDNKLYLYCPTCKCFMKVCRNRDKHDIGECNSGTKTILCKLCGLRFTIKAFKSHKMKHKSNPKLKLRDLKFENIQTKKEINPPFPVFKKCNRCHVHFCSATALNEHVCNSEEPKICVYCAEKFSDLAFNLHVPFHEYSEKSKIITNESIPELMKKYESLTTVWNILFLCETCDIIMDNYDKVVEHCQDHFSNMESYNVNIKHCRKCNLNFIEDCYTKHIELHSNANMQKDSFKILVYKYDALLSKDWMDIFKGLRKEQVEIILSKSMYKYTRSVRMKVLIDGHAELTLYQCRVCNLIIPAHKVSEHSQIQNGCMSNVKKFVCTICSLFFASKNHKDIHENLHEALVLGDKSHRIIQFFADKQFHYNDSDHNEEPEELKFIRCQHCGKLINKAKYKKHMQSHSEFVKNSNKVLTMRKLKKFYKKPNIVPTYYVCKTCDVSIAKSRINVHKCITLERKTVCPKCSLWVRVNSFESHVRNHEKDHFNTSTIKIVYFVNGIVLEEQQRSLRENKFLFYECKNCKVCLSKRPYIKKHICSPDVMKATCSYCSLKFHRSTIRAHNNLHKSKVLSNVNIYVYKFEDGHVIQASGKLINASGKFTKPSRKVTKPDNIVDKKEIHKKNNKRPASSPSNYGGKVKKKLNVSLKKREPDVPITINFELTVKDFRRYISTRYFKCKICNLHFVTGSALIAHENICKNDSNSEKCNSCGLVFHESMIGIHKAFQRCKDKKVSQFGIVTVLSKGINQHLESNWIYLCAQCNLYNVSYYSVMYHINSEHKCSIRIDNCDKCKIRLSYMGLGIHRKLHHGLIEIPFSDLNVATVERVASTDSNDRNDSSSLQQDDTHTSNIDDHKSETSEEINTSKALSTLKGNSKKKSIGIFNCNVCNINFININSLTAHKSHGLHNQKQFKCSKCDLYFSSVSLRRHMILHHKDDKLRLPLNNEPTQKTLIKTKASNSIIAEKSLFNEANSSPAITQENKSITYENSNKLFKCNLCDIHFLTADACYVHASAHTPLDPTEYIACKICDLQFLCENLGIHMKCHRDKTFCMDDLIITEYQLDNGKVKMDTYLAVDRLKSKLVSTTTHSDIEDEKAELYINGADSTTENVSESPVRSDANVNSSQVSCHDIVETNYPTTMETSVLTVSNSVDTEMSEM